MIWYHFGLLKSAPNPVANVLRRDRREDSDIQGESPREDEGRDWSDTATPRTWKKQRIDFPLELPVGMGPCPRTVISDFWLRFLASRTGGEYISVFVSH